MKNKCPYEVLYKTKPDYNQLRSFGCLCYPTLPKVQRDKLQPRTTPHVFVGYPFGTKVYKVMSLATKRIHVSRDVVFHEHLFPFTLTSDKCVFPSIPSTTFTNNRTVSSNDFDDCIDSIFDSTLVNQNTDVLPTFPTLSPSSPYHNRNQSHSPPTLPHRRSQRESKISSHLKDYIYSIPTLKTHIPTTQSIPIDKNFSLNTMFTKHHHITPNDIASISQAIVENICHDSEPLSYEEAALSPA